MRVIDRAEIAFEDRDLGARAAEPGYISLERLDRTAEQRPVVDGDCTDRIAADRSAERRTRERPDLDISRIPDFGDQPVDQHAVLATGGHPETAVGRRLETGHRRIKAAFPRHRTVEGA